MAQQKLRPVHPGLILRDKFLSAMGITQQRLANMLGVSRRTVSEIVNARRSVTPDMAHRLACFFDTSPEFWLNLQQAVDVWDTLASNESTYREINSASTVQRLPVKAQSGSGSHRF